MSTKWLDELQDKVASCWEWHSPAAQIEFQYVQPGPDDDFWEIWAYPPVQEIVGGKDDGETVWSGFNFDVLEFLNELEPESLSFSTRQLTRPPEMTFEGKFCGNYVFLHIGFEPPEDAEATEIIDVSGDDGPVTRDKP